MINLVVDYGNSSAKVGIFKDDELVKKYVFTSAATLRDFMAQTAADHVIVSSVNTDAAEVCSWSNARRHYILNHHLPLPVRNGYDTPETLGVDRLASICGAWHLYPGQASLVIDAGTCITYDVVDATGLYRGGAIAPGMTMRFRAMHEFTARLPLAEAREEVGLIGRSTQTCLQSGVIFGVVAEMEGFIARYTEKFESLRVFLCGGDARFFENKLKASIFAIPELVLSGLNSILTYNVGLEEV